MIAIIASFIATVAVSVSFGVPKRELLLSGFVGIFTWQAYVVLPLIISNIFAVVFLSSFLAALAARILAPMRKCPQTVFLIPGILPLVPGKGVYYTMRSILDENLPSFIQNGVNTMLVAGAIAVAIAVVAILPLPRYPWSRSEK